MSLTPVTPNLAAVKSFWKRPEGKAGAIVLAGAAALGVYGFILAIPFLTALFASTLTMVALGVALFGVGYTLLNKTFQSIVGNAFRLVMRKSTGVMIELDPIGILENTRDKMKENLEKFSKAVSDTRGAQQLVQTKVAKNTDAIKHAITLKEQADVKLTTEKNPIRIQQYTLARTLQLEEITRKNKTNINLKSLLAQTTQLYNMVVRWQQLAEYNVDNTDSEIANAKDERTTILTAYAGLSLAQKLIKGDPEQLKMLNASLEYLADTNAAMLGEMEDFGRYSDKYLTNMDLEQGANAADAEKMLASYENKLISAGASAPASIPVADAVPIARATSASGAVDADYLDI